MRIGIGACVFPFALALASLAAAGQDDARLDTLFGRLKETPNILEAYALEQDIWGIWLESGDVDVDAEMEVGMRAMGAGDYAGALRAFDSVVESRPELAEGWNKRATLYYLMGEYDFSVRDIQRTLALEPRHFGRCRAWASFTAPWEMRTGRSRPSRRCARSTPSCPGSTSAFANFAKRKRENRSEGERSRGRASLSGRRTPFGPSLQTDA